MNYNQYVNAINKIFECINKMKMTWSSTDKLANIDKIEEYRNEEKKKSNQLAQTVTEEPKMEELGQ